MTVTLIITTYKWVSALELVLKSLIKQSRYPEQIIIAEDAQDVETANVVKKYNEKYNLKLLHINHPDEGFRRSAILNKAIKAVTSDYIIQLDGDCIMHKHFVRDHAIAAEKNIFISGYRNHLREDFTTRICKTGKLPNFLEKVLFSKINSKYFFSLPKISQKKSFYETETANMVYGCNMSYWKKDVLAINGYDEDFVGWGHEDYEFAQRLINKGVKRKNIRYGAVLFHLYHPEEDRKRGGINMTIRDNTIANKATFCKNGIEKL